MITVTTTSIGEAWLEIARDILDAGRTSRYDGMPIRELEELQGLRPAVATLTRHPDDSHPTVVARRSGPSSDRACPPPGIRAS